MQETLLPDLSSWAILIKKKTQPDKTKPTNL